MLFMFSQWSNCEVFIEVWGIGRTGCLPYWTLHYKRWDTRNLHWLLGGFIWIDLQYFMVKLNIQFCQVVGCGRGSREAELSVFLSPRHWILLYRHQNIRKNIKRTEKRYYRYRTRKILKILYTWFGVAQIRAVRYRSLFPQITFIYCEKKCDAIDSPIGKLFMQWVHSFLRRHPQSPEISNLSTEILILQYKPTL